MFRLLQNLSGIAQKRRLPLPNYLMNQIHLYIEFLMHRNLEYYKLMHNQFVIVLVLTMYICLCNVEFFWVLLIMLIDFLVLF
ncbi:hypothetical protein GVAV_002935 [Gurleya vavrai]